MENTAVRCGVSQGRELGLGRVEPARGLWLGWGRPLLGIELYDKAGTAGCRRRGSLRVQGVGGGWVLARAAATAWGSPCDDCCPGEVGW